MFNININITVSIYAIVRVLIIIPSEQILQFLVGVVVAAYAAAIFFVIPNPKLFIRSTIRLKFSIPVQLSEPVKQIGSNARRDSASFSNVHFCCFACLVCKGCQFLRSHNFVPQFQDEFTNCSREQQSLVETPCGLCIEVAPPSVAVSSKGFPQTLLASVAFRPFVFPATIFSCSQWQFLFYSIATDGFDGYSVASLFGACTVCCVPRKVRLWWMRS
mmetsp:Transcript_7552/g.16301  ORF Transcript_7552/g.16301 Transcript_7552/m.16301 type:complete len:217 (+) Transcript_7552:4537-5187(+)